MKFKIRFPRIVLFTFTTVFLLLIALSYFYRGALSYSIFPNKISYFGSLIGFTILFFISLRSVFYCKQVTCAAVYIIVLGVFYKLFPSLLQKYAIVAFFIAMWVIVSTARHFVKEQRKHKKQ